MLPRVPTPAEQDSAATALLTSTSPPKLTIENDAALLNGADAWADAPSFSRGPSSARASSTSPGPGPNERNEEDDLDPAQIAARDRLDLTPSPSRGEHHHDDDDEDMDDDDDHEPPRHASLGLSSLPTRDEENGFRDFDIPDPQFLTDAELSLRGYTWITAKNGDIPDKAVQGGYVQKKGFFGGASKEPLFVARVKHGPAVVPGKAGKFLGGCNYSLGDGVERMSTTYQVGLEVSSVARSQETRSSLLITVANISFFLSFVPFSEDPDTTGPTSPHLAPFTTRPAHRPPQPRRRRTPHALRRQCRRRPCRT